MPVSWNLLLVVEIVVTVATLATAAAADDASCLAIKPPPKPVISGGYKEFLEGETFSINCTAKYDSIDLFTLEWEYPRGVDESTITIESDQLTNLGIWHRNITVRNATKAHAGAYKCFTKNNCKVVDARTPFQKIFVEEPFLNLTLYTQKIIEYTGKKYRNNILIKDYPPATFEFLINDKPLPADTTKYKSFLQSNTGDAILEIHNLMVNDSANYTLYATNGYLTKTVTFELRVVRPPEVSFGSKGDKKFLMDVQASLQCDVTGYPLPSVEWIFTNADGEYVMNSTKRQVESVYKVKEYVDIHIRKSMNITCKATNTVFNKKQTAEDTRKLLVYEIDDGFGVKNRENTWFSEKDNVVITCIASRYDFSNVSWVRGDEEILYDMVVYSSNPFSLFAKLTIPSISLEQSGEYICRGVRLNGTEEDEPINITVESTRSPVMTVPAVDKTEKVHEGQTVQFNCQTEGVPPPKIQWYKDLQNLHQYNDTNIHIITEIINHTVVNSTVIIDKMRDEDKGTYECVANGVKRAYTLAYQGDTYLAYLGAVIIIIFILIIIVIYLSIKIRKEKQFRRELAAAGLLYFKEGVTKSINPDLGIDEQAELLPYDEKFEFPREKLILGKQLGAGAFGVVFKAEARGIINAEETTEVAVKMVKKTADNMYIKALASELKIMVHLGKHINIVNLLGACTTNIGKRELSVIVEYCKFGNIHNYMQKHREVFIDQLTDNKEKNLGRVNRGFSYSSNSTGNQSDYFGANNTQETDNTFLNTANTSRSVRKVSEGYVQPEWRSNYESDYSFDGRNPRPLTSRDLLAWSFQIARGMEYLASRKVLHGDLAARNVLLAEDNIVKICDFGLAKSIYKNDEYQKKENSLLPVKWLAIECMTDRIFSTQSDVWSFGIVLWEIFSLAMTPYPNISPANLLEWLSSGKRLAKPPYADDRLYGVMLKCWEQKPTGRPTFSDLQEIIGGFLEDNVRNHYVDLNASYVDMNAQPSGHEDYLIMMNSPDYNNLVTPSPHHYVNDARSFFPATPTQLDDEGYLKMNPASRQNIFSPRLEDNKFDFDPRKFNTRVSEASSCGSELTPMLTLSNLPARSGSESDHEGSASPYVTMCPRIDEETDEVFEKQNNAKNIINSVSNPAYITLDVGSEKKPKDIINSYVNVSNGLVK